MFRSTMALMTRSLREDSRLLRTHLMRLLFVGLIVWLLYLAQAMSDIFGAPGLQFFRTVSYLNFFIITIAAHGYFATAITEEKEEMTLGLLRMAGVNPLAIVLGKAAPRLVGAVLLLSAQYPFTLLAISLGGVTYGQVVAVYWALVAYLLLAGSLGLFWSVVCRTSRGAAWMTSISLATFLIVPWCLRMIVNRTFLPVGGFWLRLWEGLGWLTDASVFIRLGRIMATGFAEPAISYQAISNLGAAAVLFLLSWGAFGLFIRDEHEAAPARGPLFRKGRLRWFGTGRAWASAVVWKDFQFVAGGWTMMLFKFVLYGALSTGVGYATYWLSAPLIDWNLRHLATTTMSLMMPIAVVELALYISRSLHDEVKWRTLPNLMMVPSSTAAIAYSKVAGCMLGLAPALAWFFLAALAHPEWFVNLLRTMLEERSGWWFISQCVLFIHFSAYLSLLVKWGAAALAFGGIFAANAGFFLLLFGPRSPDQDQAYATLAMVSFGIAGALHWPIGRRLKAIAGR